MSLMEFGPAQDVHGYNAYIGEVLSDVEDKLVRRMRSNGLQADIESLWGTAQDTVYGLLDRHPDYHDLSQEELMEHAQFELEIRHANAWTQVTVENARRSVLSGTFTEKDVEVLGKNLYTRNPQTGKDEFIMSDTTRQRLAVDTVHEIAGQLDKPEEKINHDALKKLVKIHDKLVPDDSPPLIYQAVQIYQATRRIGTRAGVTEADLRPIRDFARQVAADPEILNDYSTDEKELAVTIISYANNVRGGSRIIEAVSCMLQQDEPVQTEITKNTDNEPDQKAVNQPNGPTKFSQTTVTEHAKTIRDLIGDATARQTSTAQYDPSGGIPVTPHGRKVTFRKEDGGKLRLIREHPISAMGAVVSISGALLSTSQGIASAEDVGGNVAASAIMSYDTTYVSETSQDPTVVVTTPDPTSNVTTQASTAAPSEIQTTDTSLSETNTVTDASSQVTAANANAEALPTDIQVDTAYVVSAPSDNHTTTVTQTESLPQSTTAIAYDTTGDDAAVNGPKLFSPNPELAKAALQDMQSFLAQNATPEQIFEAQKNAMKSAGYVEVDRPETQASITSNVATLDAISSSVKLDNATYQQYIAVTDELFKVAYFPGYANSIDLSKVPFAGQKYFEIAKQYYATSKSISGTELSDYTDAQLNVIYTLLASADSLVHPAAAQEAAVNTIIQSQAPVAPAKEQNPDAQDSTTTTPTAAQPAAPATPAPSAPAEAAPMPSQAELNQQALSAMSAMGGQWVNRAAALKFFMDKGWTPAQAAGPIGNFVAESSLDPNNGQNGCVADSPTMPQGIEDECGWGIAQWTSGGRQHAFVAFWSNPATNPQKLAQNDINLQLAFVWHELTASYGNVITNIGTNTTDPKFSAKQWMGPNVQGNHDTGGYENPAHSTDHLDFRQQVAQEVFDAFNARLAEVTAAAQAAATPAPTPAPPAPAPAPAELTSQQKGQRLADLATAYAYGRGDERAPGNPDPDYAAALADLKTKVDKFTLMFPGGADCAQLTGTVVLESGFDPSFPYAGTYNQLPYFLSDAGQQKWQEIPNLGNSSNLQPGDIFILSKGTGGLGHTFVYIGNNTIVAASGGDYEPYQQNVYFSDDRGPYHIFRLK